MLLWFAYIFVLFNAFTADAELCEDEDPAGICKHIKRKGECQMGRHDCNNTLGGKTCYEMYEKGQCEVELIAQKLCRQMCNTCW
uniref:ShKT domain-containing protein n=1 Tax=Haemonchus contortus TaxID=6289 RepID=W6NVV9_HAECO